MGDKDLWLNSKKKTFDLTQSSYNAPLETAPVYEIF